MIVIDCIYFIHSLVFYLHLFTITFWQLFYEKTFDLISILTVQCPELCGFFCASVYSHSSVSDGAGDGCSGAKGLRVIAHHTVWQADIIYTASSQ